MELGLASARVIITGGASNIGRAICHAFAAEGSRILIADIDEAQAESVRAEAIERGAEDALVCIADLALPGSADTVVETAVNAWGGLDAVVNNAGWSKGEFLARDDDRERWRRLVDVNFIAVVEMTRAAIPALRASGGGSAVLISSEAAFGQIRQGVYGASKAAGIALARTLAREHGRHNIRSNIVCPGLVVPDDDASIGAHSLWAAGKDEIFNDAQAEYLLKDTPLGRLTAADDVANAVVWLSSPTAARQVTGQLISVSGGYTMP
jgi:2-hydroxycyclohexanecarboxyl-CoA dehydrogenase